jgi:hypothetical protein
MSRALILLQNINNFEILCEIDNEDFPLEAIKIIAQVLMDNKEKYPVGNWKKVPVKEHLDHAGIHLINAVHGFQDEPHLHHALTRLAMVAELKEKGK